MLHLLNDKEIAVLKEVIRKVRAYLPNRPRSSNQSDDYFTPDVYLALPQSTITGIERVGTGSTTEPSDGDQPGSGICDIYQLVDGALEPAGFSETVYNLDEAEIVRDWILVFRTKFGDWFASPSGTGGGIAGDVLEGVLDGSLSPASNALDSPSTAILSVYRQAAGTGADLEDSLTNITVTNRFTEITAVPAGTWMVVRYLNGEWRPIAADCAATQLTGTGT